MKRGPGTFAAGSTPAGEFNAYMALKAVKWGKVTREAGVKAD